MSSAGKIIAIAAVGKSMLENAQYQRVLPTLAVLVMLATLTGALAGLLVALLCYALYTVLMHYGVDPGSSLFIVGICMATGVIVSASLARQHIRKLRSALQPLSPITSGISDVADAFMDGLRTPARKHLL